MFIGGIMILKKIGILFTAVLTILIYQNCSNFDGEVTSVKESKVSSIDSFEVNIKEYPYTAPGTKVTTKITAVLDQAIGIDGKVTIIKDRFLITHLESSQNPYKKCTTVYSVNRDDIRNLLKAIDEMEIEELSAPSNVQVADLAIYELTLGKDAMKVRLGGHNVVVGQKFTFDLSLSDFTKALNDNKSKVISDHCAVK